MTAALIVPAPAPAAAPAAAPAVSPEIAEQVRALVQQQADVAERVDQLARSVLPPGAVPDAHTPLAIFHGYLGVFVAAFLVAIVATPIMRRLALGNGVVDRPDEARKLHRFPIAYLGGVGVYLGIVAGIFFSYTAPVHGLMTPHATQFQRPDGDGPFPVPISILGGLTVIMLVGLLDDVLKISPWQKIAGQLMAAAFLAMEDVGVKVAYQLMVPIGQWVGNPDLIWHIPLPTDVPFIGASIPIDLVYWTGTGIIAVFVLGACNASNLIDGLDGLLSGVTGIAASGLLVVALWLAAADAGPYDSARIVLCLALLGGCMGFLPHNFNPAVIFLGDCGSLMLGFATIVIILTLGEQGRTDLVVAGLIIYAIPIIDTVLAIIRRKLAGKSISDADDQHLHHMFKRALGVKGAVLTLYVIGAGFASLGVVLAMSRARVTYALALVFALFIGVIAIKVARRKAFEDQALALARPSVPAMPPVPPGPAAAAASAAPTPVAPPAAGNGPGAEPSRPHPAGVA